LRIISGKYKGKRIDPPKKFPSRPTTDMAKEGLFNILENQLYWEDIAVLDLFAGTGNMSVEFISRGANKVISVDVHPISIRHMNKIKAELDEPNWLILKKDVFRLLSAPGQSFEVIFADPPFDLDRNSQLPDLVLNSEYMAEGCLFILEHGQEVSFDQHPRRTDVRNYGGVFFSFFR